MWFAQTLGLRFGEPDFWKILRDWPASIFEYWKARYLLEPWDAANRQALIQLKHEPPAELTRKGRFLSKDEIQAKFGKTRR